MSSRGWEMPPDKARLMRKAIRLEWLTLAYLSSAVFFIYLTLGSSQAMKTAWFEDMLSLIPSAVFLIAARIRYRPPTERFQYGYHRAVTIAFLCASIALFSMGLFLLFEAISALLTFEHPSIGTVVIFGRQLWLGWLMIPALLWSAIPAMILGRIKLPIAAALHDKVLHADATMNKADWLTAFAAIVGVVGIAFGLWWADGLAAGVISLDILHDGYTHLRAVVADLMGSRPTTVDEKQVEALPARVRTHLQGLSWVREADVRMREEGHVFFGEAFVVPTSDGDLTEKIRSAVQEVLALDWRLQDIVIMPVAETRGSPDEETDQQTASK